MVATTTTALATPKAPTPFDGEKGWGQQVTPTQLAQHKFMPTPTKTHCPVDHSRVVDYFSSTMERLNFVLSEPAIFLSNDEFRSNMYVGFGVAHPDLPTSSEFQWQAFLINSHNKKFSLQIGAGTETFVCSNGMVMAPMGLHRTKHTKNIDVIDASGLPRWQGRIMEMCDNLTNEYKRFTSVTDSLKKFELDPSSHVAQKEVQSLVLEAALQGIVNPAGAVSVYKHWQTPEHQEFREDKSVDRLRQAFTSHDREKSVFNRKDRNSMMIDLFSDRFGTLKADGTTPVRSLDRPVVSTTITSGGEF